MNTRQIDLLSELFMGQFPDRLNNPRMEKCRTLYRLAREVRDGVIVELGTFHGCGAISLAWGARAGIPVYTIDDYIYKHGWVGEEYKPEDKAIFEGNCRKAKAGAVKLIERPAEAVAPEWQAADIALLFWDIGGDRLYSDFQAWKGTIQPGGVFAIHDTSDLRFGTRRVFEAALASGEWENPQHLNGLVHTITRK